MIWTEQEIRPTSTLFVHCASTVSDGIIEKKAVLEKPSPEIVLNEHVLRMLFFKMDAIGMERFEDDFYHGLIHPFNAYDLFCTIKNLTVDLAKPEEEAQVKSWKDGFEFAGFRFYRTTTTHSMILMGKSSRLINPVNIWLMNPKDLPEGKGEVIGSSAPAVQI